MESKLNLTPLALDIFEAIKQGRRTCLFSRRVCTRFFIKRRSKDIDVEVHHLSFEALKEVLSPFGTVQVMGASFALYIFLH